jgi:hypothetical protein
MTMPGPDSGAAPATATGRAPRQLTVHLGIALAFIIGIASAVLLLTKGPPQRVPDGTIVAEADHTWAGVMILVEGPALDKPVQHLINDGNRFSPNIFVPFGSYVLRAAQGDRVLLERQLTLTAEQPEHVISLLEEATARPIQLPERTRER